MYLAKSRLGELDVLARRYGVLPSDIVNLEVEDFCLNLLVANIGAQIEEKALQKAKKESDKWRRTKPRS